MNRVQKAIDDLRARAEKLSDEDREKLNAEMDVDGMEHFQYQETQAWAHVSGKLTTDEAQIVYAALGEVGSTRNGGWARGTDLPTKVAVTLLMGELLPMKIRAARVAS